MSSVQLILPMLDRSLLHAFAWKLDLTPMASIMRYAFFASGSSTWECCLLWFPSSVNDLCHPPQQPARTASASFPLTRKLELLSFRVTWKLYICIDWTLFLNDIIYEISGWLDYILNIHPLVIQLLRLVNKIYKILHWFKCWVVNIGFIYCEIRIWHISTKLQALILPPRGLSRLNVHCFNVSAFWINDKSAIISRCVLRTRPRRSVVRATSRTVQTRKRKWAVDSSRSVQ